MPSDGRHPTDGIHTPDPALRGTCMQAARRLAATAPDLTPVAGWYWDPQWGREEHWWCERPDGSIVDPTAAQYPSNGAGKYERYSGSAWCLECGAEIPWETYLETGEPICGAACYGRMVGVPISGRAAPVEPPERQSTPG